MQNLPARTYKQQIFSNTLIQTIAKVVSIFVGIGSAMILTRYLGPAGYGEYNTVIVFVFIFSIISDLGVYQILLRELSQKEDEREKILGNIYFWRIISSFSIFFLAAIIGFCFPYGQIVKYAIVIEAARSFVYAIRTFYVTDFKLKLRMDIASYGEILNRISFILLLFVVFYYNLNFVTIFIFIFLATVIDYLWVAFYFRKISDKIKPRFDSQYLKLFLKESLPVGVSVFLGMLHFKGDTLLLSILKSPEDVGIYSVGYRILENVVMLPGLFLAIIFPKLSQLAINRKKDLAIFFNKTVKILIIAVLPISLFLIVLAPWIVTLIAGPEYSAAIWITRILSLAVIAIFLSAPYIQLLIAARKQNILAWISLVTVIVNLGLNLIFIPKYSYQGAAVITLLTEILLAILVIIASQKLTNYKIRWSNLLIIFPLFLDLFLLWIFTKLVDLNIFTQQLIFIQLLEIIFLILLFGLTHVVFSIKFKIIPLEWVYEILGKGENEA